MQAKSIERLIRRRTPSGWLRIGMALCLASLCGLATGTSLQAQSSYDTTDWRAYRASLEQQFGNELQDIANWCRANGIPQQVEQTFRLYLKRDLGRQYILLPDDRAMPKLTQKVPEILGTWFEKVNRAKRNHADRIFDMAQQAAATDRGTIAFQLLNEVIYYNRDHAKVRKILGHRKTETGWKVASDSVRVRHPKQDHDIFQWDGGDYIKVLTPHFEIDSNASEAKTRYLAEQLERCHEVWRQVFFEYWSSPAAVKNWIAGKSSLRASKKRYRVVFCKNRAEYLKQLSPLVRGVEVSTGYYSADQHASFFYDGDEKVQDTWRHELTHQLFRESGGAKGINLEAQFIWLDEGIATYFESLKDYGGYVTLGGFDASRMQYARIRRILENFYVPSEELSLIGRKELQKHPDLVRLYSQSAGMTDMLMNDQNGAFEERVGDFIKLLYKGRLKKGTFNKVIGKSFEEIDQQYEDYLIVNSELVERGFVQPEKVTELSVPGANLRTLAYEAIGECKNLTWLDISRNAVGLKQLEKLRECKKIDQLIMTECRFTSNSLYGLEYFPTLNDVDLSGSSVQDAQLASFRKLGALKTLRLTATGISDAGLLLLANVPNLEEVDVARTRVTDAGIASLRSARPGIRVTK